MSKFELINDVDVKLCAFTAAEMKEAEHEYNSFVL